MFSKLANWSLAHYKLGLVFSFLLLFLSLGVLANTYLKTGDFIERGIDFRGGTEVVVPITSAYTNLQELQEAANTAFSEAVFIKETKGTQKMLIFASEKSIKKDEILSFLDSEGITYDSESISTQEVGATLGDAFWSQAKMAIIFAFIVMAAVVFYIFKNPITSTAVVLAGTSDFIFAAAMMDIFGINLSLGTLAALLILIGYSVDTDILLTTRVFKRHDDHSIDDKMKASMKTGITMTISAIAAMAVLYLVTTSAVLSEIALVILFGLIGDLPFTWIQNVGILKWYVERKK